MTLPVPQAVGTGSETSCAWPTHQADDWGYLAVEHGAGTVTTPTGCTIVPGFPVAQVGGTSTLSLFRIKATSGAMPALALAGGTDHMWGVIFTVRGADLTAPEAAAATCSQATATTMVCPGLATYEADCLIFAIGAYSTDSAGPMSATELNSTLGSVAEQYDAGTITGNGGGLIIISGTLAIAGTVGLTRSTVTSSAFALGTIAVRPPRAASGSGISRSRAVNA